MRPKNESNLSEAFRIFLDETEVTSSNPFGISLEEDEVEDKYLLADRKLVEGQLKDMEVIINDMTKDLDKWRTCTFEFDMPQSNLDSLSELFSPPIIEGEYECVSIEEGKITFERVDGQQIFFECAVKMNLTDDVKVGDKITIPSPLRKNTYEFKEISKEQQEKDRISSYDYLI